MNLLINTESLRPPLTGIANYTYHLVKELSASRVIDRLRCFDGQKFLTPEQMLRQCDEAAAGYHQASPARNAASSRLTAIARRVPGAYRTRQAIRDLRLLDRHDPRSFIYPLPPVPSNRAGPMDDGWPERHHRPC
jgi:alpha-1,3-rhamnosyl/mannosyltransferase